MMLSIYCDGSGKPKNKFCYVIAELNKTKMFHPKVDMTNNQAEYFAVYNALQDKNINSGDTITIYSDSQLVVNQLNHDYAINNAALRFVAARIWEFISTTGLNVRFVWIERQHNLAGKALGS